MVSLFIFCLSACGSPNSFFDLHSFVICWVAGPQEPSADQIFQRIRSSQAFLEKCETEEGQEKLTADMNAEDCGGDPEVAAATVEIIQGPAEPEAQRKTLTPEGLPTTLAEALGDHKNLDATMSDLWKLLYFLRSGEKGADLEVLPNALGTRQCVKQKDQKWHNKLMSRIAHMDAQMKMPAMRQSRQAAWNKHNESQRQRLAPSLPPALEIDRGDVVCVKVHSRWEVCWVISVYRNYAANSGGAQLTTQPLPRGNLHSVRIVRAMACLFWISFCCCAVGFWFFWLSTCLGCLGIAGLSPRYSATWWGAWHLHSQPGVHCRSGVVRKGGPEAGGQVAHCVRRAQTQSVRGAGFTPAISHPKI